MSNSTQGLHELFEYLAAHPGNYVVGVQCVSPHPRHSDHDLTASMLPSYITYQVFGSGNADVPVFEGRTDFYP